MTTDTRTDRPTRDLVRVKVSLMGTDPEIWRLLELDASLTLDRVHEVLQLAMGWRDSHLHMFTDADPYDPPQLVDGQYQQPRRWMPGADPVEIDGLPETEETLDHVLTEQTGPLYYEYDFGDGWTHRLELIETLTVPATEPAAQLVRGERRAPPEDCGGVPGHAELLDAVADPAHERHEELMDWVASTVGPWRPFDPEELDVDAVNSELARLFPVSDGGAATAGPDAPPLVAELTERMPPGLRPDFRAHVRSAALDAPAEVDAAVAERMVTPYLWLIRRVSADGLDLTAAGWLPPVVVRQAMAELGWEDRWIGKHNREDQTLPVLLLREQAQRLGLVRKLKGRLVISAAVRKLLEDPVGLWFFVARSLAHRHRDDAERDATLLLALEVAAGRAGPHRELMQRVAFGLEALGWQAGDGWGIPPESVSYLVRNTWDVLAQLGTFPAQPGSFEAALERPGPGVAVLPGGQGFARAVLRS